MYNLGVLGEHPIKKVQAELQRQFRLAGKGSVSRVQQQLGLGKRYFQNQRNRCQKFDLRVLFDALRALEVDAAQFFTTVLGPTDCMAAFRGEAAALRRRRKRLPRILVLESQRPPEGSGSSEIDLAELDALRYDDPKRTMACATAQISEIDEQLVPTLLGIYGSACRIMGRLDEAQVVLGRALDLAEELEDAEAVADLTLRCGYVAADRGHFELAYSLAERATLESSRLGDLLGVAKALVEQGNWSFCLGRYRQALSSYRAALKFLPETDTREVRRNRLCCLMNSGITLHKLGDLVRAEDFARRARSASDGVGGLLLGNLAAFQAAIAKERGESETAEKYFRESIEIFAELSPVDTAFSVVELCRLHLDRGQPSEAATTARMLLPFVEHFEKTPLICSYVTDLLRCAVSGYGLTSALLDQVTQGLKKGRAQPSRTRHNIPISR